MSLLNENDILELPNYTIDIDKIVYIKWNGEHGKRKVVKVYFLGEANSLFVDLDSEDAKVLHEYFVNRSRSKNEFSS